MRRELTKSELELLLFERFIYENQQGHGFIQRYGLSAVFVDGEWSMRDTMPDLDGSLPGGRQFVLDLAVAQWGAFDLADPLYNKNQLRYMLEKSRYQILTGILIHYSAEIRKSETSTILLPVAYDHPLWLKALRGEFKTLSLSSAREWGIPVDWNESGDSRVKSPDVISALYKLAEYVNQPGVVEKA